MIRELAGRIIDALTGARFAERQRPAAPQPGHSILYFDARTQAYRHVTSDGDSAIAGSGSGTLDHAALTSNLAWTSSGHTGTANRIAGFNGAGAAEELEIGVDVQAWDADLDSLSALASTGLIARTGIATYSLRSIASADAQITVANGDGVAGNPTVTLAYASAVRETGGPTTLTMGGILDGQILKRSGSAIVGETIGGLSAGIGDLADTLDGASLPNNRAWGVQWIPGVGSCWAPMAWGGLKCLRAAASQSLTQINDVGTGTGDAWDGAIATAGSASGGRDDGRRRILYSGTTNNYVNPAGATAVCNLLIGYLVVYGITTYSDITNSRIKVYLSTNSSVATQMGSTTPTGEWIELRYDTGAGDAVFKVITSDGATQTTTSTSITPAASTAYDVCFSIAPGGGSVQVWVAVSHGVWQLVATHSTNLPTTTTGLYTAAACNPLSGTKGIGFSNVMVVAE